MLCVLKECQEFVAYIHTLMEPGQKRNAPSSKKLKDKSDPNNIDFAEVNAKKDFETVTFDFLEPDLSYASNVYSLIQKNFAFFNGDLYELVELICQQKEFGIFLSVEEDDQPKNGHKNTEMEIESSDGRDVYACLSIIKLDMKESMHFSKAFKKCVLEHFSPESKEAVAAILNSKTGCGLLVSERVINLPFMVVPQIYEQLMEDKQFIDSCPDYLPDERAYYDYEFLVYFVKSQEEAPTDEPKATPTAKGTEQGPLYRKEDRLYLKHAMLVQEMPQTKYAGIKVHMIVMRYKTFLELVLSRKLFN